MRRGGFYGGLYESCANAIDDSLKLAAIQQISAKCGLSFAFLGAFSMGYQCKDLAEMVELSEGGVVGFGDGNQNCARTRFLRLAMECASSLCLSTIRSATTGSCTRAATPIRSA